jgi:HAD superfamily hydrolase (TIGR01490 family)
MAGLALFDFDGTLTERDTFRDFVLTAVPRHRKWAGAALLAPVVAGYQLGLVSPVSIRAAIVRMGFTGMPLARAQQEADQFAARLPSLIRPQARKRLDWHRARGDRIVVVSAGLELYLRPWCRAESIDLLGSRLQQVRGRLSGRFEGPQCAGREKATRVRAAYSLALYDRIYAYGDTSEDRALLGLAHERWYRWTLLPEASDLASEA